MDAMRIETYRGRRLNDFSSYRPRNKPGINIRLGVVLILCAFCAIWWIGAVTVVGWILEAVR